MEDCEGVVDECDREPVKEVAAGRKRAERMYDSIEIKPRMLPIDKADGFFVKDQLFRQWLARGHALDSWRGVSSKFKNRLWVLPSLSNAAVVMAREADVGIVGRTRGHHKSRYQNPMNLSRTTRGPLYF